MLLMGIKERNLEVPASSKAGPVLSVKALAFLCTVKALSHPHTFLFGLSLLWTALLSNTNLWEGCESFCTFREMPRRSVLK